MPDNDVILGKIRNIQNCLKRIRNVTNLDPATLETFDVQDIFVLNVQRAVQSAIDLAAHIVATEGFGLPERLKEYFELLAQNGILSSQISKQMIAMVGFRNIAVHDYDGLDVEIMKSVLQSNLIDLEHYYASILNFYNLSEDQGT